MPKFVSTPAAEYDVVVVGGGFAGATASTELAAAGLSVLVVEARDRLSGRMWFDPEGLGGHALEWGGAFMLDRETYPIVWSIIDRAGLALEWGSLEPTELIWLSQGSTRSGALPVPFSEIASFERSLRHVEALAARIDPTRPLDEQDLSGLDVPWSEVFDDIEIGPHTRDVWRAHIVTLAGDDWDVPSALPLLHTIAEAGSIAGATFFDAPFQTPMAVTLGPQLRGGTQSLFDAVFDDSGAEVLLDTEVTRIDDIGDRVRVTTSAGVIEAGHVLSAVAISALPGIAFEPELPHGLRALADEGVSAQAEKISVLVSNCARPWYGHGIPEGGGFATASTTWHEGDRAIVVGFTSAPGALDPDDAASVQRALDAYVPGIVVEEVRWHDWTGDPYSRGTWTYLRPGQTVPRLTARRPHGRVFFAGSDFDRRLGVEGALHTGALAASEILAARASR